jgi:hypothetical protein
MNYEGYSPRKVIAGVTTAGSSELDKRVVIKEKVLHVKSTRAIAVESQATGNRVRVECIRFESRIKL